MSEKIRIHFIHGPIKVKQRDDGIWKCEEYPNEEMLEIFFEDKEHKTITLDEATTIVWHHKSVVSNGEMMYQGYVWYISPIPGGCIKYKLKPTKDILEAEEKAKQVAQHLEEQYKLKMACSSLE